MRGATPKLIRPRSAALAALAVVLSGCGSRQEYPPEMPFPARADRLVIRMPTQEPAGFGQPGKLDEELAGLDAIGGKTFDPADAPPGQRQPLETFLADTFGTPAAPRIAGDTEVSASADRLGLTSDRLAEGGKLFRRHCVQCHGMTGDGRGPTGLWINPHPRDFRRGAFKFVSTGDGGKPRRSDLARTIRDGLKGTAMPAFALLPEDQRDLLASYVIFLSLRGQVEFQTLAAIATEGESENGVDGDPAAFAAIRLKTALRDWEKAQSAPGAPPDPLPNDDASWQAPERFDSVRRGYELFTAPGGTSCISCHQDFGRKATYRYDVWGTVVRPADLTGTNLKSGNGPDVLFHRVRGGIQPSGMPAHPTLTDAQVWDLVHFVRALPYARELPPDVRAKVYPE
ncbi:MAG TPA: cytochrome c [Gemmataceae bacterium]|nr:cytochrome c [Gemmataceae bacterium]